MKMKFGLLHGVAALAFGGFALLGLSHAADAPTAPIQDGKLGLVVSSFGYAFPDRANEHAACPNGLSQGPREIYAATPEGHRHDGETDQDYARRLGAGAFNLVRAQNGQNLCMNPEAGAPDPHHRVVTGNIQLDGLDLDGQTSRTGGHAAAGTCAHDDFRGVDGARNVDNQFYRALGCTPTMQSSGQGVDFGSQMLVGEWGILITLENVQDLRNDNDVTVRFYANADPMELSPTREPLANATYAYDQNPRYQATTHGRIVNGILTTDPVDVRFHWVVADIRLQRPLDEARLRAKINPDGSMEGVLGGYAPVEEIYDTVFGFRDGLDAHGQPASLRLRQGSSTGYALNGGHTCNGVYYALRQLADGHKDPATGRCTAISMQYRLRAIPAFVVNASTRSSNASLDGR